MNDVQVALDNSIEGYFASIATRFIYLDEGDSTGDLNGLNRFLNGENMVDSIKGARSISFSSGQSLSGDTSFSGLTITKRSDAKSKRKAT